MKKELVTMTLAAAMTAAALAGCGSSSSSSSSADSAATTAATQAATAAATEAAAASTEAPAATGDQVTLNVIAAQYGQNTASWWADFQKEFNEANPGINLNVEVVSWNDIYTVVNTRIANGQAPDILNIDVFADFVADDLLVPASEYTSDEVYNKLYPSFLEQSDIDGTIWAIPDLASARALYYNKDILDAAGVDVPTTWDELEDACAKIKAYDSSIYPWGIDMTTDEGQAAFAYYTWNNGGGFVDDDNKWALNSDKNVEAVQFEMDLYNKGYTNSDPANETRYDLQDMFGAGQLAMVIGPNSIPTYISDGGYSVNYGVAAIPNNSTGESVSAGVMDRFMVFDSDDIDSKLDSIKTFFEYFYDDDRYTAWVEMEGFLPATTTGGETLTAKDPNMANWIDILSNCKFYPTAKSEWADVKQGVIDVEQQALLGGDVQELLDNLQSEITAVEE